MGGWQAVETARGVEHLDNPIEGLLSLIKSPTCCSTSTTRPSWARMATTLRAKFRLHGVMASRLSWFTKTTQIATVALSAGYSRRHRTSLSPTGCTARLRWRAILSLTAR
eukprot:3782902-Prymnesium_polylepis.1